MRLSTRAAAAFSTVVLALLSTGCGPSADQAKSEGDDEIVFAAVPSEESSGLKQDFDPVLKMLEKETGKEVKFQQATDYAAIIEGQRAGKIDIAKYGPFSYVLAGRKGVRAQAVAAQVKKKGMKPGYKSFGITEPGSEIRSLADFRGKKVCFVDPTSTSGYLYPTAGLMEAGVDPKKDIQPVYSGGHDAAALAVASGECAAGFAYDTMVERQLVQQGQLEPGELRTVWRSRTIPGDPVAISRGVDRKVRERITTALREKANSDYLRSHGFCDGKCRIGDINGWGFTEVDDSYYDSIRRVCDTTGNEQCR